MRFVDTHCHWNEEPLKAPLEEQRAAAAEAGVVRAVVVGFDLPSSRRALELARQPGVPEILAAVGLHPHDARTADEGFYEDLRALLAEGRTVAYCSDAGMPGINDPGFELARLAREAGAGVVP